MSDLTLVAVERQLKAMAAGRYVLSVGVADKMINSTTDQDGVVKRLGWLRAENAAGKNIYIKPVGDMDLVLIDDLDKRAVGRLLADGLRPALVAETSPDNFQAWVRVGGQIDDDTRRAIARVLAREYGGDFGAASKSQPGRLAGFANCKPKHLDAQTGRGPWVTLQHWSGYVISASARDDLLRKAESEIESGSALPGVTDGAARAADPREEAIFSPGPPSAAQIKRPARAAYEGAMRKALNDARRAGVDSDLHRCDWKVVREMTKKGYSAAEIADAMIHESPGLPERHRGDQAAAYVRRTVSKSFALAGSSPFGNPFARRAQPAGGREPDSAVAEKNHPNRDPGPE